MRIDWQTTLARYPRIKNGLQGLFFLLITPLLIFSSYWTQLSISQDAVSQHATSQHGSQSLPTQKVNSKQLTLQLDHNNHYVGKGSINGLGIHFLIDTGASQVAISSTIANQLDLVYGEAQLVTTASGDLLVYPTVLNNLFIGNIHLRDVPAYINHQFADNEVLVGMNVLKTLDWHKKNQQLTLIQIGNEHASISPYLSTFRYCAHCLPDA